MVLLNRHQASIFAVLFLLTFLLSGCNAEQKNRSALVEANPLSSGTYHIEIVGKNSIVTFAYQTDVLDIAEHTQWDGNATVGAYQMAFHQECHSVFALGVSAKQWRGKWVHSTATSPRIQLREWLELYAKGEGIHDPAVMVANTILQLPATDERLVTTVTLANAPINWNALCDAHLDSLFGSQAFLTDAKTGTVTMFFDTSTKELIGVKFATQHGQTTITGTIIVSVTDGHNLPDVPELAALETGTLYEEWEIVAP